MSARRSRSGVKQKTLLALSLTGFDPILDLGRLGSNIRKVERAAPHLYSEQFRPGVRTRRLRCGRLRMWEPGARAIGGSESGPGRKSPMLDMRRREFVALLGSAAMAWPLAARAQQPTGMRRVGILMNGTATGEAPQSYVAALVQGLRQLGWIEGQNLRIDVRWNAGDAELSRIYAAQLIGLMPDVIVASSTTNLPAIHQHHSGGVSAGLRSGRARFRRKRCEAGRQSHRLQHLRVLDRWQMAQPAQGSRARGRSGRGYVQPRHLASVEILHALDRGCGAVARGRDAHRAGPRARRHRACLRELRAPPQRRADPDHRYLYQFAPKADRRSGQPLSPANDLFAG